MNFRKILAILFYGKNNLLTTMTIFKPFLQAYILKTLYFSHWMSDGSVGLTLPSGDWQDQEYFNVFPFESTLLMSS